MSHFITYLALEGRSRASAAQVMTRYRELFTEKCFSIRAAEDGSAIEEKPFVLLLDDIAVAVMFVERPLPLDACEEALALDIVWPEARQTMMECHAHAIVALIGDPREHLAALNGAAAVTLVAGTLADLLEAPALVSSEGRVVMKRADFMPLAVALADLEPPVPFWTSIAFFSAPDDGGGQKRIGAASYGLQPFIGRELEFQPAALQPYEIARRLVGLFQYLILNGPVIEDDDTVGVTKEEKIRARLSPQGRRPGLPIIELTLERLDDHAPPATFRQSGAPASGSRKVFGKRGL